MPNLLWPTYDGPGDLAAIEAVPLADRGLPGTTYELLVRAADLWPDRVALSVLPDGDRWGQPTERTSAELLADVHRYANVFHALGVRRTDGVALLAPNCDELITSTLAAQLAGIAAAHTVGVEHVGVGVHVGEQAGKSPLHRMLEPCRIGEHGERHPVRPQRGRTREQVVGSAGQTTVGQRHGLDRSEVARPVVRRPEEVSHHALLTTVHCRPRSIAASSVPMATSTTSPSCRYFGF